VKEVICGRSVSAAALFVKGPAKDEFRGTIMFSSHVSEPVVDERGLPDTRPGNDCNDIDILVCPCTIQKSDILLPTKNIASSNSQPDYGQACGTGQQFARGAVGRFRTTRWSVVLFSAQICG
jgi:hypothetical protein